MKRTSIFLTILASLILSSCGNSDQEQVEYGSKIVEDLTETSLLDDNYRNYYEIYVGSFYDSNGDGWGDLNGVTSKLDYIKETGFNGIWLMPIFKSPSYHKYDVTDYYQIDPKYGTMNDFKNLLAKAHDKNIKVILDMVVNHCSKDNQIFIDSYKAYDKYLKGQTLTDKENEIKDMFSYSRENKHGYHKVPGKNFYYEGNFSDRMPEFNLDNSYAKSYLNNIYDYYIGLGVDGFRLDAVKYFYLNDTEKNIAYLNEITDYCKAKNPRFYIVGECWDSSTVISKYYESNADSYFNFELSISNPYNSIFSANDSNGVGKKNYLKSMKKSILMANGHIPANFLDNHDMHRYATKYDDTNKFYFGLISMMSGNSFTYYGDELGTTGRIRRIGNRNYDEDVRRHFHWSKTSKVGICNDPKDADTSPYEFEPLDVQKTNKDSIYNYYKKANLLRNQNPSLVRGNVTDDTIFETEKSIGLINKVYNNEKIGILINFSEDKREEFDLSKTSYTNVIGQLVIDTSDYIGNKGNNKISIPSYGIAIVK